MNRKSIFKSLLALSILVVASCSGSDDDGGELPPQETAKDFVLGLGVTTGTDTNWYVLPVEDLMSGTISLQNQGIKQDGYRDFATGGNTFYSTGGLNNITDMDAFKFKADNTLEVLDNLTFPLQIDGLRDVDGNGNTMLGISQPQDQTANAAIQFYNIDIATNTIADQGDVPFADVNPLFDSTRIFHTGMQVSGDKLYHTFYFVNKENFNTPATDAQYVAIYDYPAFTLDTVIKDERFGPAGAFNTRSGIFTTENGDLYTVSNSNFGFSQATKPAGILRIPAGENAFDPDYTFNTETAPNGGKIIHAIYIGNNKLFAAISTKVLEPLAPFGEPGSPYFDEKLKLSIVDLEAQRITLVDGAPEYTGDGGRSFAAFQDGNQVYSAIRGADGILNIYRTDLNTATATKGAQVDATFVGGIAKLK